MLDADVVEGKALAPMIAKLFEPRARYSHAHFAKRAATRRGSIAPKNACLTIGGVPLALSFTYTCANSQLRYDPDLIREERTGRCSFLGDFRGWFWAWRRRC